MVMAPDDFTKHKCECGSERFYLQTELLFYPHGSYSGENLLFECAKCGIIYDKNGIKQEHLKESVEDEGQSTD